MIRFALLFCLFVSVNSWASIGTDWLSSQSNSDGSYGQTDDISTTFQSTTETLRTFIRTNSLPVSGISNSLSFVAGEWSADAEYLSRKMMIKASIQEDVTSLLGELTARFDARSGGFSGFKDHQPSVQATAFALEALAVSGHGSNPSVNGAISYIVGLQSGNGSWSEGSLYETALSLTALSYYRANGNLEAAIIAAQSYLFSRVLNDGTWGETFVSATVISALLRVVEDASVLTDATTALLAAQHANGSWENDTYVTALAERALFAYNARQSVITGNSGALSGFVRREVTGESISEAVVSLLGVPGIKLTTNSEGYFRFPSLLAGRYTVFAEAGGFASGSVVVDVVASKLTPAQDIVLAYANNSGLVQGHVFDQTDRRFLEGVRLSLDGATDYTAISNVLGHFEFSSVLPGTYTLSVFQNGYNTVTAIVDIGAGLLTYNQGLLKEGAFLDSLPSSISATTINGDNGQRLMGATLDLGNGLAAVSDADGRLIINAVPRDVFQATLSLDGFESRAYILPFNPGSDGAMGSLSLFATKNITAASSVNLIGTVVDGVTGQRVNGATVTVVAEGLSTISDAAGAFNIPNIGTLSFDLQASVPGYQMVSSQIVVSGFGDVHTEVKISPVGDGSSTSVLTGIVSDTETDSVIAGVEIMIPGTGFITTTGVDGRYTLSGINLLEFTVVISVAGYEEIARNITLAAHGNYQFDTELELLDTNIPLNIMSVKSDSASWMANSAATFSVSIDNQLSEEQTFVVTGEILTAEGQQISQLMVSDSDGSPPTSEYKFLPSERKNLTLTWETGLFPAGAYSLLVRVAESATANINTPRGTVVSEYILPGVQINELIEVGGAMAINPPLTQAGATTPVSLQALLQNNGNVALNAQAFQLDVLDEAQVVLHSVQVVVPELPLSGIYMADFGRWLPTSIGNLQVNVRAVDAAVGGEIVDNLYVGDKASGRFSVDKTTVPEGTQTVRGSINLQGVDAATGGSTDPLFVLVREAVKNGGAYVSSEVQSWQNRNRCLGCHVQSQSLMGLASSVDKAEIDPEAVKYTYNAIVSAQNNGVLGNAYTVQYSKTQTLLGFWSLAAWPDKQQSYLTQYRAASALHRWRIRSGNRTYWRNDHAVPAPVRWWYDDVTTTAITAIGLEDLLTSSANIDLSAVREYSLTQTHDLGSGTRVRNTAFGPDESLYVLKENGQINRIDMISGTVDVVATGLGGNVRGLDVAPDGTIFISAHGHVSKINTDGSIERLYSLSAWFMDVALSANGDLYVSDSSNNRIITINLLNGVITEVIRDKGLNSPVGLGFDHAGNLLVANKDDFNILRLNEDLTFSKVVDGLAFKPLYFDITTDGTIYATTDRYSFNGVVPQGMVKITPDGIAERIQQGPPVVRSVSIDTAGAIWVSNESSDQLDQLTTSVLQPTLLPALRDDMVGAVNFLLNNYRNSDPYNVPHAMRMLGLAAAKPHINDAALLSHIDLALQYGNDLIRARQNADGGWGRNAGNISDPLITAMMGLALDELNPSAGDPQVRSTIVYLLSQQGGDGSWFNVNNALNTRLSATSFVMAYMPKALERLGGIDVDLYLSTRPDVALSHFTPTPTSSTFQADGSIDYYWQLQGVTASGQNVDFDIQLQNLSLNESRAVAATTFIEFNNSFTTETMRVDLDIPEVTARSEMQLSLALNKARYQAGEDIDITTLLSNAGITTSSGQLSLLIRPAGTTQLIAQLPSTGVTTLAGGAQQTLNERWNTSVTLVGDYEVFGQLVDTQGRILDEAIAPFTLETTGTIAATSVATDKPVYAAWDAVDITARVINAEQNNYLPSTVVEITVTSPDQSLLFFESRQIGELAPNALRDLSYRVNLSDALSGQYQITLVLKDNLSREDITGSSTLFQVQRSATQGLSGSVTVEFPQIYQRDPNSCTSQITNIATTRVTNLELSHQLVDIKQGVIIDDVRETLITLTGEGQSLYARTIVANSLTAGDYACVLQVRAQNNWQTLAYGAFTVTAPPVNIDTLLAHRNGQRLLVLLDTPNICHDNGADDHPVCTQTDAPDPHGPLGASSLNTQRNWLENQLKGQGISYRIATDTDTFTRELRSGRYTGYALFAEHLSLSEQVQQELREAVYRGEGLLVAGLRDQPHRKLDQALGVEVNIQLTAPKVMILTGNQAYADGYAIFRLGDDISRIELAGAEVVSRYLGRPDCDGSGDDGYNAPACQNKAIAITRHAYGRGRSVMMSFDLLVQATARYAGPRLTQLLAEALADIQTPPADWLPQTPVLVRLSLSNAGSATPGQAVINVPLNSRVLDAGPAQIQADGRLIWPFTLMEGETTTLDFWLQLPPQAGPAHTEALIQIGSAPDWTNIDDPLLTLTLVPTPTLAQVADQLEPLKNQDISYQNALIKTQSAQGYLDAGNASHALADSLQAAEALATLTANDAAHIRSQLAQVIRNIAQQLP